MLNLSDLMPDKYNIHTGKAGIINLLSQREKGVLSNCQYKTNVTNVKVNQLPKISERSTVYTYFDDEFDCIFVRSGPRGDLIAWGWYGTGELHGAVCVFEFTYNSPGDDDARPLLKEVTKKCNILPGMVVTSTADLSYMNQKPLLIVGELNKGGSAAILTSFHCDYVHQEYEWRVEFPILCCASVVNSENFALGCLNGFYVCKHLRLSKKYNLPDAVIAADFNDDGNLLFISCNETGIQLCDMRENIERYCRNAPPYIKESALNDSSLIANRMKLLSDQVTLIVSDIKGNISKVDLRMKQPVFQYPEHKSFYKDKPLNIDEDLDLLCAAGNDSCCRIWSLSSGKLQWAHKITDHSFPPEEHACIVSSERRWFVVVLKNGVLTSMVPDESQVSVFQPPTVLHLR